MVNSTKSVFLKIADCDYGFKRDGYSSSTLVSCSHAYIVNDECANAYLDPLLMASVHDRPDGSSRVYPHPPNSLKSISKTETSYTDLNLFSDTIFS